MIGNRVEYEKMFRLEGKLWWYRILHESVGRELVKQFGDRRDIAILDAGCGTGGLLNYLRRQGYTNFRGIDFSEDAVSFCRERNLPVEQCDLSKLPAYDPQATFDAIICDDVLYFFDDQTLTSILAEFRRRLRPGGLICCNINAFNVFRGEHDVSVGSERRYVKSDFMRFSKAAGLVMRTATYWSLALSPLILLVRQWQALQLRMGWHKADEADSDLHYPGDTVNELLYRIVRTEQKLLPRTPFGSSLFMTFEALSQER